MEQRNSEINLKREFTYTEKAAAELRTRILIRLKIGTSGGMEKIRFDVHHFCLANKLKDFLCQETQKNSDPWFSQAHP